MPQDPNPNTGKPAPRPASVQEQDHRAAQTPTGPVSVTYNGPEPGVDVNGQRFDLGVPTDLTDAALIEAVRAHGGFTMPKAFAEAIAADVPRPQEPHISPT